MEMRTAFIIGIAAVLFTLYYLEKEMEKRQIFWLYAGLGVALGITSVYMVAKQSPNFDYYLTFAVLSVLIAILYYDEPEEEAKLPDKEKKPKKRKHKGR
jgi:peptidoglycan/LPS O-acetylase OafA/YrhL